ncbi:hypothetical protein Pcinc_034810 [Petrolisthes cinctipes]|uniref:Uncharacterized protein n=1 Tax=Petrolisthes cinctipes TaxID=88211 RepID=A0AAE1EPP1_PETCI|nr:hypothetical protein Pcinc_034810 [Petrolisthes cinctipes]
MSKWRKDPLLVCGDKHNNATLEFHECVCEFDYRNQRKSRQALKYKHCLLADEMRRIDNFQLYVVIAVVVGVVLIFTIAAFCSCKWYFQTNKNPCSCFSCFSCKKKKKKKKDGLEEREGGDGEAAESYGFENGNQSWIPARKLSHSGLSQNPNSAPIIPPPPPTSEPSPSPQQRRRRGGGFCMKFCLSDPVQDCCEFFDCDLMWRKKSIYTIPVFGRRKLPPLQRRPTRPAPPPPKPSAPPAVKNPMPVHEGFEDMECDPVPEAPPSPEPPIRMDQPRAMYVDPLAFLQRPFLKATKEKAVEEPDAIYSKKKGFFFGRNKKSGSVASLNHLGEVSSNPAPDATSTTSSKKSKYSHTGSLASLNNLSEDQLDAAYQTKRSMSLASLNTVEEARPGVARGLLLARSRGSLHNIAEDDIPPSLRTDEYIDLEEMSKRIEAKMQAGQGGAQEPRPTPVGAQNIPLKSETAVPSIDRTPDFVPASAYTRPVDVPKTTRTTQENQYSQNHPKQYHLQPPQFSPQPQYSPKLQHTTRPQFANQAQFASQLQNVPRPQFSPRLQHTPQHQYSPRLHHTPQYQYSPRLQHAPPQYSPRLHHTPSPQYSPRLHHTLPPQYPPQHQYSTQTFQQPPAAIGLEGVGDSVGQRYYPPVPATLERPAVPARHAVGTPVSSTGTLGRPKPQVPPRPGSNSPKPNAPQPSGRVGHVVKPTAPPPPPPVTTPIESSL